MKTIMIVDDSTVMRKNLRSILTNAGYQVVAEATNGEEAYRMYSQSKPDLVTMDVTMPIMNGIDAVKRIIADDANANIIVISAFDQRSMLFDALENGAKHYIIKPITSEKLLAVVDKVFAEPKAPEEKLSQQAQLQDSVLAETNLNQQVQPKESDAAELKFNEPISIENHNGKFVVKIPAGTVKDGLLPLQTALQGLLFIKPLSIAFDFGAAESIDASLIIDLEAILGSIRQAGGHLSFISQSEAVRALLLHTYSDIQVDYA
jgi:DNA-binding NarL/FixJ family response regulator